MKSIVYSKHAAEELDSLSVEELLNKISDYLLQSGFNVSRPDDFKGADRDLQSLHDAILNALLNDSMISEELQEQMQNLQDKGSSENSELSRLVNQLIQKLARGRIPAAQAGEETGHGEGLSRNAGRAGAI